MVGTNHGDFMDILLLLYLIRIFSLCDKTLSSRTLFIERKSRVHLHCLFLAGSGLNTGALVGSTSVITTTAPSGPHQSNKQLPPPLIINNHHATNNNISHPNTPQTTSSSPPPLINTTHSSQKPPEHQQPLKPPALYRPTPLPNGVVNHLHTTTPRGGETTRIGGVTTSVTTVSSTRTTPSTTTTTTVNSTTPSTSTLHNPHPSSVVRPSSSSSLGGSSVPPPDAAISDRDCDTTGTPLSAASSAYSKNTASPWGRYVGKHVSWRHSF